jgi:hypothetical protein
MSEALTDKFYTRLEIKRNHLTQDSTMNTSEKLAWAKALEWCYDTLIALQDAEEAQEAHREPPEMPDGLSCETCDD